MIFHIPYDGSEYLNFKCAKCGWCCRYVKYIQLTLGDVKRLTKTLGYKNQKDFLEKETVFAEIEVSNIYPQLPGPAYTAKAQGFFLKRFKNETEETVHKSAGCRFLGEDNLCTIYEARPMVCRKMPYSVHVRNGLYEAYYVVQEKSLCQGYRAKRKVKIKWLAPWVKTLIEGCNEILESLHNGFFIVTEAKKQ